MSDILPTGFEIGVQYGDVNPGDVVAVIGSGPVGLSAVMTARLYGPSKVIAIDLDDSRLKRASDFGATDTVNSGDADWKEQVFALTDGQGVDVAIEAVGVPQTFTMATEIVRPGGSVANIGVHGKPVELALNELWIKNIDISMGLVNTNTLAMLLKLVTAEEVAGRELRHARVLVRPDPPGLRRLWQRGHARRAEGAHSLTRSTRCSSSGIQPGHERATGTAR